jgi:hypothetical protein
MRRALIAFVVVAVGVVAQRADLGACGDKSLSAGGIKHQKATASKYPASILIYGQPNSRISAAARELKLQSTLSQVGHTYREIGTWPEAEAALKSGRFNIVMADVALVADLKQRLAAAQSRAVVVPIVYKATKAEADLAKQSRFVVKAPSRAAVYLDTIADAVRLGGADRN